MLFSHGMEYVHANNATTETATECGKRRRQKYGKFNDDEVCMKQQLNNDTNTINISNKLQRESLDYIFRQYLMYEAFNCCAGAH